MRGMRADRRRTVPVALDGLGVEGGDDAKVLSEAVQQPARGHDLVANLAGAHRADLELPLPRHHLRIDAADDQARLHQLALLSVTEAPPGWLTVAMLVDNIVK